MVTFVFSPETTSSQKGDRAQAPFDTADTVTGRNEPAREPQAAQTAVQRWLVDLVRP